MLFRSTYEEVTIDYVDGLAFFGLHTAPRSYLVAIHVRRPLMTSYIHGRDLVVHDLEHYADSRKRYEMRADESRLVVSDRCTFGCSGAPLTICSPE